MNAATCPHCGNKVMVKGFIGLGCPLCGGRVYTTDADEKSLWAEHRHSLMFKKGGWRWLEVLEPPAWFVAEVA